MDRSLNGPWWEGAQWYSFTGDALKVDKLLVKFKFTEEAKKYIFEYGLYSGEKLDHLDEDMRKSFVQKSRKPNADQKGMVVSITAEVLLKLLILHQSLSLNE